MAIIEDIGKAAGPVALVGVGVALVAPTLLPAIGAGLRPLAKALVKGGVMVYDSMKETVAEAGEQLNDLVAEARSEMSESEGSEETDGGGTSRRRKSRG
jgi:hypothetical protein